MIAFVPSAGTPISQLPAVFQLLSAAPLFHVALGCAKLEEPSAKVIASSAAIRISLRVMSFMDLVRVCRTVAHGVAGRGVEFFEIRNLGSTTRSTCQFPPLLSRRAAYDLEQKGFKKSTIVFIHGASRTASR